MSAVEGAASKMAPEELFLLSGRRYTVGAMGCYKGKRRYVSRRMARGAMMLMLIALTGLSYSSEARADVGDPCMLPSLVEWSSWTRLGGGLAIADQRSVSGLFDIGLGGEALFALRRDGHVRLGPWVQVSSSNFLNISPAGGLEFLWGLPLSRRHRLMPWWVPGAKLDKEVAIALRAGGGWSFSSGEDQHIPGGPIADVTLTVGIRTYEIRTALSTGDGRCRLGTSSVPPGPHGQWYSWGVRGFISARSIWTEVPGWQVVGGIEIEPMTLVYLPKILWTWAQPEPWPV
jgi:hypothetical protein